MNPGPRLIRLITEHFARYRRRTPWAFCWRIAIESVVVMLAVGAVLFLLAPMERRELLNLPYTTFIVLTVLIAPIVETLLLQALPIALMRLFKASFRWQVAAATAAFAGIHFAESLSVGLSAGLVGGFYFGFTYAHWRERSRWTALWTTTLAHAIHNGVAVLLLLPNWLAN